VFESLKIGAPLANIELRDQMTCRPPYVCTATGRVIGREIVRTTAGTFETVKAVIEQEWHPVQQSSFATESWGARTLTIWYAPEVKRAVRYSSRLKSGSSPTDANFDLELLSYHLN
jgi:hypothetical protein